MAYSIAKLGLTAVVLAALGISGAAGAAAVKRHGPHPLKKSLATADASKPEKLVRAPGGVMVPRQAPGGRNPGFMDDGASKRGQKP